jgi:hypothetical protein
MGTPPLVHLAKNLGARFRRPSPYRIRVAANMILLEAENALMNIPAFTIDGRTRRNQS